jgi:signal transduction histidine kinase/ActR/RegA family two-component response regulator
VGVLQVWRTEVHEFDTRAIRLLTAFASAAAIAIRNLDLVRALETRTHELARKVDQLEALGTVGALVSSSLDLDQVLSTIVMHAVQLSETDGGSLMEYDPQQQLFFVRTAYGTSDAVLTKLRSAKISIDRTLVGRAAREGRPLQTADISGEEADVHQEVLHDAGWRSMLAVPMLREEQIVGVLVVRRLRTGEFSSETCELMQTFASQSCLAILNARLFGELEQKSAQLQIASQHKSEFLASMSHELRTPLNAVIGFSEVLIDRMFGEINERQEEYLRDIWNSGKHLLQLLSEILDLSKVEAGRMELANQPFAVDEALEYAVSMVRERAERRNLALSLHVAGSVGLVDADELRFKQVILNLLSNAAKFTPDGGAIRVEAKVGDSELTVTVADTGVGVAPEDCERIFESFQQGPRGTTTQEGTGLGLTLCRRIVDLMGGRMWLDSEVGVGSTFGFSIPVTSTLTTDSSTTRSTDVSRPTNVLLIEDDRPSADLMTAYLTTAGLAVETAHNGTSGLEVARRDKPAVIVLDIRLPGIDGWEVLKALKSEETTMHIPVVIVSVVDERARGLGLGATEHLVKPVNREDMLSALAKAGVTSQAAEASPTGRDR